MKVKTEVSAKYFILDILPVEESLMSVYEDIDLEEILNTDAYRYVDLSDDKLYSPRLQFMFNIEDGKHVYLVKFNCYGYNIDIYNSNVAFDYTLRFKIYPDSTRFALVTSDNKIIKGRAIDYLPSSFIENNEGIAFDDYIELEINGSRVVNFSNPDFFKGIEKLFS